MDNTETRIKMCEKATEIQNNRPDIDYGEWFAAPDKNGKFVMKVHHKGRGSW